VHDHQPVVQGLQVLRLLGVVDLAPDLEEGDLDDALPDAHAGVEDAQQQHLVVLVDELGAVQDELADEVHGGLAHHRGSVEEAVVDAALYVVPGEDAGSTAPSTRSGST
jgi:hypothetical protein